MYGNFEYKRDSVNDKPVILYVVNIEVFFYDTILRKRGYSRKEYSKKVYLEQLQEFYSLRGVVKHTYDIEEYIYFFSEKRINGT